MKDPCFDPEALAAWKDGLLPPAEAERLLDHATTCASCRQELATVHTLPAEIDPEAVSPRVRRAVLGAVDRERISRRIHVVRSSRQPLGWVAGVAALLLLAIGALLLIQAQPAPAPETETEPAPLAHYYPSRPNFSTTPSPEPVVVFDPPVHPVVEPTAAPIVEVSPTPTPELTPTVVPTPVETTPTPTPSLSPVATPSPSPSTTATPGATVVRSFDPVTLTDLKGEVSLRRKGRKDVESLTAFTQVGDGDVLITEKAAGVFVLADVHVALMPKSIVGVAREHSSGQLSLLVEAGEAMIDGIAGSKAGWLASDGHVSLAIDGSSCTFSVAVEPKAFLLTALSGSLSGRDDAGRTFKLRAGERLSASPAAWTTGNDPVAGRKLEALAAARPLERTLFLCSAATTRLLEGRLSTERTPRGEKTFIRSAERKGGIQSIKIDPAGPTCSDQLVIRLKVMTNIQNLRFGVLVEDKTALTDDVRLRRDQLRTWTTIEIPWNDLRAPQVQVFSTKDRFTALSITGRDQDVFGDDKGYILIDELSFAVRPK